MISGNPDTDTQIWVPYTYIQATGTDQGTYFSGLSGSLNIRTHWLAALPGSGCCEGPPHV